MRANLEEVVKAITEYLRAYDSYHNSNSNVPIYIPLITTTIHEKREVLRAIVQNRAIRMRISVRNLEVMTTSEMATLCDTSAQTVINWIDHRKIIRAERVATGPRRILTREVFPFLKEHFGTRYYDIDAVFSRLEEIRNARFRI